MQNKTEVRVGIFVLVAIGIFFFMTMPLGIPIGVKMAPSQSLREPLMSVHRFSTALALCALGAAVSSAWAYEPPPRKPGLWEMTMSSSARGAAPTQPGLDA